MRSTRLTIACVLVVIAIAMAAITLRSTPKISAADRFFIEAVSSGRDVSAEFNGLTWGVHLWSEYDDGGWWKKPDAEREYHNVDDWIDEIKRCNAKRQTFVFLSKNRQIVFLAGIEKRIDRVEFSPSDRDEMSRPAPMLLSEWKMLIEDATRGTVLRFVRR